MADDVLIQGKTYPWLVDDQGNAYVNIKASSISLGAAVNYDIESNKASATVTYYGEAAIGSATSAAVWRVKKVTLDADGEPTVKWEMSDAFDKVWDTYEAL